MLTPRTAPLLTLLLAVGSLGQRAQRPPRPPSPISTIQPKAKFDTQQFSGTWFLVAVASSCRSLQEQGHRAEATTLHVTPQGAAMAVSTFRKLDGICWQVRQLYGDTGLPGRFLLQARGARGAVDVVVGETDYRGFAIVYLERARQLSVKLYGTSPWDRVCTPAGPSGWVRWAHGPSPPFPLPLPLGPDVGTERRPVGGWAGVRSQPPAHSPAPRAPCPPSPHPPSGRPGALCVPHAARSLPVSESFLSVFEQRVQGANLTEDHILFFPKYGFCEAADQFHVLDEVKR
ncbi:complement component C8 gamma chain isoform 1-T1 [Megaptera novaeangliae]